MTDTRWYRTTDIVQGAQDLKQRYTNSLINWMDYALQANELRFRDEQGQYWYLDALQDNWYRYDGQEWQPVQAPPVHLEGLTSLINSLGILDSGSSGMKDPFEGQERMSAQAAFETLIEARRSDFTQGRFSTSEIEQMLERLLLLDRQGDFWTIGFRSNRWYRFRDNRWTAASQPPHTDQLTLWQGDSPLDQLSEQAGAQVITFLLYGAGTLPEPISEPWTPPSSFPDLAKPYHTCDFCAAENPYGSRYCNQCGAQFGCPQCGSENPPGSRFCNQCGASLLPAGGAG